MAESEEKSRMLMIGRFMALSLSQNIMEKRSLSACGNEGRELKWVEEADGGGRRPTVYVYCH